MSEFELAKVLKESGLAAQGVIAFFMLQNGVRLSAVERRLDALTPDKKPARRSIIIPIILAALLFMFTGCVRTEFAMGSVTMKRTALLTKVEAPNIEVSTNGTLKASVTSDSRAEILESLARAILSAGK